MILKVKKLDRDAKLPSYAHPGDAGLDLFSNIDMEIAPGETALVPTGISIELPPSTEAQVRPKSGLALKNSITVLNTPGTIDEGFRGEVGVILINHSRSTFKISKYMKIAQMLVKPVVKVEVQETDNLTETKRGPDGFGSTGH